MDIGLAAKDGFCPKAEVVLTCVKLNKPKTANKTYPKTAGEG
jgi:hypothetical protein